MEYLTPPVLQAVREIRWHVESGKAMKEAVQSYLNSASDSFAMLLREAWVLKWQGKSRTEFNFRSRLQTALWRLIERGCAGQPSMESLCALESEIEKAAQYELESHLAAVPFKILIPLLLFQFPAYLVLLLGPVLRELNRQMGS
jgi:hypothetical protein